MPPQTPIRSACGRCAPSPRSWPAFDPPDDPWGAGHRGVDLLGSPGQRVHAALAGTRHLRRLLAGRGVVVVDHGDTRTTYEPVTADVRRRATSWSGAPRSAGWRPSGPLLPARVPALGLVARRDLPRPADLVGAGPVRLLPLWRDEPVAARAGWPPLRRPRCRCWRPLLEVTRLVGSGARAAQARGWACR